MLNKVKQWFADRQGGKAPAHDGKTPLQENAEKALQMKRGAGATAHIPDHETAHEGGVPGSQVGYSDTAIGKEPTYTPNLKRSHNPRTGDA